jgi:large subunit ribosomal protein L6
MLKNEVEIPGGVEIRKEDSRIAVKGPKGVLERRFSAPHIAIKIEGGKVILTSDMERKKIKATMGTWAAHLRNMISGVTDGWAGEIKMVYSHFPVKLKAEGDILLIENFLGERSPRKVPIPGDLKVDIDQNVITVSGIDKEKVGQLCARIEQKTRVSGFDKRVFQDGCVITRKPYLIEGENEGKA